MIYKLEPSANWNSSDIKPRLHPLKQIGSDYYFLLSNSEQPRGQLQISPAPSHGIFHCENQDKMTYASSARLRTLSMLKSLMKSMVVSCFWGSSAPVEGRGSEKAKYEE
jgi:hypothetical protein